VRLLSFTKYEKVLGILFVATLPLCNPWVRGDGVGYYAYARSILFEHRLDFTKDSLSANTTFRMGRVDVNGHLLPDQLTVTGRIDNRFAIGPAILWSPFLIAAHAGVLLYDRLGGYAPADGFSKPYRVAMALGTAICGFLAVLISLSLARRYVPEKWAFIASLGMWFASSLPVYMYFNPSWSRAHSAFIVRKIIYGSYLTTGYKESWDWRSPAIFKVCIPSEHGLFTWTPILLLSVVGLFLFRKHDRILATYSIAAFAAYLYVIGCDQNWDGSSSFGNRIFVSLTVLFTLGFAGCLDRLARAWQEGRVRPRLATL
jgi:hypothetical protein